MISGAQLEVSALRALTFFPYLLGETGIEERDFLDPSRRAYVAALRATRHFAKDGSASPLDVGQRAGLSPEWVRSEVSVRYTVPEQAREVVRQFRNQALGERFAEETRDRLGKAQGTDLLQAVGELARSYAVKAAASSGVTDMEAVTLAYIDAQMRRIASGKQAGAPTGLRRLDRAVRGWRPGELTTLVATGGSGKSTLAEWWRRDLAKRGTYTLKFAGEMTEEQEGERITHAECRRPMSDELDDILQLADVEKRIRESGLLRFMRLCARSRFEPTWIRGVIEAEKVERGGLGLVVIDHLRHLVVSGRSDYEIVSNAAAEAKAIAKDCTVPVLLITHTNRSAEHAAAQKGSAEPDPSMIRGSGRIFEESDNVLCLWRPEQVASLYVWKARQTGTKGLCIGLEYDVPTQDYSEVY